MIDEGAELGAARGFAATRVPQDSNALVDQMLWLLGPAPDPELHGPRLTMMMERTIDTTVRGIIYEGTAPTSRVVGLK